MSIFSPVSMTPRGRPNFSPRPASSPLIQADDERLYQELIAQRPALLDEKLKLHAKIIDEFNLAALERMPRNELVQELRGYVAEYVRAERIPLNQRELQGFVEDLVDEMIGYGPIEPLLKDPTVTDILINTHKQCYVERFGKLEESTVHFKDDAHLLRIVQKIVAAVGRRVDESSPMVDARLPDGSRVNVAIQPIAVDGALVSIRKFSKMPFSMERLIEVGALKQQVADVLQAAVHGRISMIISGGTGSGKTTLLNALSNYIPPNERIISIEDACRPHGDPSPQRGRQGRIAPTRAGEERTAYAARPHHNRRMPWRRSLRHVAGDEHWSRRIDDHDPCQ
jgi:pilus assembly protein CpaF